MGLQVLDSGCNVEMFSSPKRAKALDDIRQSQKKRDITEHCIGDYRIVEGGGMPDGTCQGLVAHIFEAQRRKHS